MWFIGRELQEPLDSFPTNLRTRALAYVEARIAAAEAERQRDGHGPELSPLALWCKNPSLSAKWLLSQLQRVFRAGVAVNHAYLAIEWASELPPEFTEEAVALLEAIAANPRIEGWTYSSQRAAIRSILARGGASDDKATLTRVETIISLLSSIGETSFLDLVPNTLQ
jgi:hypothetical protein